MRSQPRLFVFNDPHPMRIDGALAAEIGLEESIVLLQLEYLISISTAPEHDGRRWTYQSLQGLHDNHFQWWSVTTIGRIIKSLEAKQLITVANFNKKGYDRTRWYAVNHEGVSKLHSIAIYQNDKSIVQNEKSIVQSGDIEPSNLNNAFINVERPIPETPTEIPTEEESERAAPKARTRAPRKRDLIFEALAEVTCFDSEVGSNKQRGALNQFAGKLRKQGTDKGKTEEEIAETVRYVARYFKQTDWRGKRGDVPTAAWLQEVWGAAIAVRSAKPPAPAQEETDEEREARLHRLYVEHYAGLKTVHPATYRTSTS